MNNDEKDSTIKLDSDLDSTMWKYIIQAALIKSATSSVDNMTQKSDFLPEHHNIINELSEYTIEELESIVYNSNQKDWKNKPFYYRAASNAYKVKLLEQISIQRNAH